MDGLLHLVAQRLNVTYPLFLQTCFHDDGGDMAPAPAADPAPAPAPTNAPPHSTDQGTAIAHATGARRRTVADFDPTVLFQTDPHWRRTLFRSTFYLFLHFSVVARAAHADFLPAALAAAGLHPDGRSGRRLSSADYYRTVVRPFFAQHHLHSPLLHWALYVNYCGCPVWCRAGAAKRLALLRQVSRGRSWMETELAVWQEEWKTLGPAKRI
jgi:hypothetical protein